MNNIEKKEKYSNLMSRLKRATDNEYYYEAIFIEYAILEDRTESLLKHAGKKFQENNGNPFKISKKLNKLKSEKEFQTSYIRKHLTEELIEKIYEWKIQRDKLMHNIINLQYKNDEIKMVALNGECLVKKFNSKSQLVNKYLDNQYK